MVKHDAARLAPDPGVIVVLASESPARAAVLRQAGVEFTLAPAVVDEVEIKAALRAAGADGSAATEALAELKAQRASRRAPGALVVGADQLLECEATWFGKPADLEAARAQLHALRGHAHELVTTVCVVCDGANLWHHTERSRLVMRGFSDRFIDRYLAAAGEEVLGCVGAYRLEGLGVQLFESVEGDYFSILGLPLLPLLDFLRNHGAVAA